MADILGPNIENGFLEKPQVLPTKLSQDEKQELTERGARVEILSIFFNSPEADQIRQGILQEQDINKKRVLIEQASDKINTLSTGQEQAKFLEATKVALTGIDQEWATEWQPPRPAEDIWTAYAAKAAELIRSKDLVGSGEVMFQAITLIHPYEDGNGRTARILSFYLENPQALKDKTTIETLLTNEDVRAESRTSCSQNLEKALEIIKERYGISKLPLIKYPDGVIGNRGIESQLKGITHVVLGGSPERSGDIPTIVDYTKLPFDEKLTLEKRTNNLRNEILQIVLDLQQQNRL